MIVRWKCCGSGATHSTAGPRIAWPATPHGARASPSPPPSRARFPPSSTQSRCKPTACDFPRVFIDTGAQHTLITVEAARSARAVVGSGAIHLVGFTGLDARPGLIDSLQIGGIVLHDVPVLVGNSPPMITSKGQMALGTDLMHHVRFTIDYPAERVWAAAASSPDDIERSEPSWEIPLWTFSRVCLALAGGQLTGGPAAHVLVDTGDRAGTFISARWAQRTFEAVSMAKLFAGFSIQAAQSGARRVAIGQPNPHRMARAGTDAGELGPARPGRRALGPGSAGFVSADDRSAATCHATAGRRKSAGCDNGKEAQPLPRIAPPRTEIDMSPLNALPYRLAAVFATMAIALGARPRAASISPNCAIGWWTNEIVKAAGVKDPSSHPLDARVRSGTNSCKPMNVRGEDITTWR